MDCRVPASTPPLNPPRLPHSAVHGHHVLLHERRSHCPSPCIVFDPSQYMAVAFCCLSVVPGLVSTVIYATSSWFSESTTNLELVTLGNFGLQSTNEGASQLGLLFQSRTEISGYVSDIDLASFASSRSAEVRHGMQDRQCGRGSRAWRVAPTRCCGGVTCAIRCESEGQREVVSLRLGRVRNSGCEASRVRNSGYEGSLANTAWMQDEGTRGGWQKGCKGRDPERMFVTPYPRGSAEERETEGQA
eukprot:366573-Chlamydomonas_euryale.AAC.48